MVKDNAGFVALRRSQEDTYLAAVAHFSNRYGSRFVFSVFKLFVCLCDLWGKGVV